MRVKQILCCLLICFFVSTPNICAQKYKNPTGKQFPIVAWYALDREHNTRLDYQMMAEAGFNLSLSFFSSYKDVLRGLTECEGTGVKLITYCWELRNTPNDFVPLIQKNKNLALYYVSDEPTEADFCDVKKRINSIARHDSKHLCYVNLMPNYASPQQLKSISYESYIENYLNELSPKFLSFDYYPFRYSGFREGIFDNLGYISTICKERRIPFWGFVMSATDKQYPNTNKAYLRFQAFLNLAYGAKGLQYFTYSMPNEGYYSAIVDSSFHKIEIFDVIKEINSEIQHYSKIWLNSEVEYIWYVGSNPPRGLDNHFLPKNINAISADGKGFIVSEIKSKCKKYLIVINTDVENSQRINIDSKRQLVQYGLDAKKKFMQETFNVEPGDYLLIKL